MARLGTVADVVALLPVSKSTLYSWRARNVGPKSFKLLGVVVYDLDELAVYIEQQKTDTGRGES